MKRMGNSKPQELDPPRAQCYKALLEALESLTRHGDLTELFHELAQRLRKVVHILESEQPMNIENGPCLPPSESAGGWVWQTQDPLIISDYEAETRFLQLTPTWRGFGMKSGYYLPLTTPQRRLGSINFASARLRTYDSCDMTLFARTARLGRIHSRASSMDCTCQIQKPASSSFVSANGPSISDRRP